MVRNFATNRSKGIEKYDVNITFWVLLINAWFTLYLVVPIYYPDFSDFQKVSKYNDPVFYFFIFKMLLEYIVFVIFKNYKHVTGVYDSIQDNIRIPLIFTTSIVWIMLIVISAIIGYHYY